MIDRRDTDPGIHPDDALWDPRDKVFVPRPPAPLLLMAAGAVIGALFMLLVLVATGNAALPTPPAPPPSFVAVPEISDSVSEGGPSRVVPSAPAVLRPPTPRPTSRMQAVGPSPRPAPTPSKVGHTRTGTATWFDDPRKSGYYAAAGPPLRVGDWRGRTVTVSAGGRSFRVQLSDWCLCTHRLIDLSPTLFSRFAPLSRGVTTVTVQW